MKIILKNGQLFEQTHPLHGALVDILIEDDVIVDIALSTDAAYAGVQSEQVIDLSRWQISAGWIDLHVHCFEGGSEIGTNADRMGVAKGVPIIVDAGTAGAHTIDAFVAYLQGQKTQVFSLINIAASGLETLHELRDMTSIDETSLKEKVQQYPEFIKGIKVRESGSVVGENGVQPLVVAERLARELDVPVMVHIGNGPPQLSEVVEQLRPGDIITHCYHGKKNVNILNEHTGKVHEFIRQAKQQDVIFDIGHGSESFAIDVARTAIAQGILPDTVSTDMYWKNIDKPVRSLAVTMDKIVEAGISLDDVIEKVTKNPAHALRIDNEYGTIATGKRAVFTMFEIVQAPLQVEDSLGVMVHVEQQITPRACFINEQFFVTE
jgi:dihydroorotase